MLTGLLATARELRNPLTVGYSALFTLWLLVGEQIERATRRDALGRRLLDALQQMGDAAELALYTFVAAMLGSLLWNAGVSRLTRWLARKADHPNWDTLISEAGEAVRTYEEYRVVTYKGQSGTKPSSFDARHTVPSPEHAKELRARVEERERKAAEMSFRTTLAVSLVPITLALGLEGGGQWWWLVTVVPVVWLDVALLKYTTHSTVRGFELEDFRTKLEAATAEQKQFQQSVANPQPGHDLEYLQNYLTKIEEKVVDLRSEISPRGLSER